MRAWLSPEKTVFVLTAALALAPAWLRGGTQASWTWPLTWLALVQLILMAVLSWRTSGTPGAPVTPARPPFLRLRDPIFVLGFFLIALLLLQWWNAGRLLYFDSTAQAWQYSEPRHPALPSAITAREARQMLDWFLPAWVLLLALRSPAMTARSARKLWRVLAYSGGLLSLLGLMQYASGSMKMFGVIPFRLHFYATFGYPNHAGSYFLMILCLSAALLHWELGTDSAHRNKGRCAALALVFVLSFVGAIFSLSRLAIILGVVVLLFIAVYLLVVLWPRLASVQKVHAITLSLAGLSLLILMTLGLGREAIEREFRPEQDSKTTMERETSFRLFQIQSAFHMWQDHPWVGVGGWGYRYLIGHYLPPEEWRRITEGKANVHNDPMQFLVEFGLLGAGCLAGWVVVLGWAAWRARWNGSPMWTFPMLACLLVAGQSLIDLPFRSPAVLSLWLVLLAGLARVHPRPSPRSSAHNAVNS
jgi:O-antigen ligase